MFATTDILIMSSVIRPIAIRLTSPSAVATAPTTNVATNVEQKTIVISDTESEMSNELSLTEKKMAIDVLTIKRIRKRVRSPMTGEFKNKYIATDAFRRGIRTSSKCWIGQILNQECSDTIKEGQTREPKCSNHLYTTIHTISKDRLILLTNIQITVINGRRVNWIQFDSISGAYFESEVASSEFPRMFFLRFIENNKVYSFNAFWYMDGDKCFISFVDEDDRNFVLAKLQKLGYSTATKPADDIQVNWSGISKRLKLFKRLPSATSSSS